MTVLDLVIRMRRHVALLRASRVWPVPLALDDRLVDEHNALDRLIADVADAPGFERGYYPVPAERP